MIKRNLETLTYIFTATIAINYYLSYQWSTKFLDAYGVKDFKVFTERDLLLTFGDLNQKIIIMGGSGFLITIALNLFVKDGTFNEMNTIALEGVKTESDNFRNWYRSITNKWIKMLVQAFFYNIILFLFCIIMVMVNLVTDKNGLKPLMATFMLLFPILPIAYVFWVPKRSLILWISLFLLLTFGNLMIDESIKSIQNKKVPTTFIQMSFVYVV